MKTKKLLVSFAIIILIVQFGLEIMCNATEQTERIILNDIQNVEEISEENLEIVEENNGLNIYSESAILMEAKTGKVLYEKDMHARKYPASTTKILTAILAIENCRLDEIATASNTAVFSVKSGYSIANIQVGESFTIAELLDVLMLQSANEAANVIAEHVSGSIKEFSNLMNQKAKEIGCLDTNFVNANGAHNENHYSTAYDLALIARYCMQNETFREIVTKKECSLPTTEIYQEERIFRNTNSLMQENSRYYYPFCNGIKTGFTTPAKNCLISSSNRDDFELISVILHAESTEEGLSARYLDTINLFEYGYNNYNLEEILEEYDMLGTTEEVSSEPSDIEENTFLDIEEDILFDTTDKTEKVETVTGGIKKDYNSQEKNTDFLEWIKIIAGFVIFVLASKYYIVSKKKSIVNAKIRTNKESHRNAEKENVYNFKLS